MNKTEANCFCFKGYSGLNCEIVSVEMQANKRNIQIIVAISITLFVCFVILITSQNSVMQIGYQQNIN